MYEMGWVYEWHPRLLFLVCYIGSTMNLDRRIRRHLSAMRHGDHFNPGVRAHPFAWGSPVNRKAAEKFTCVGSPVPQPYLKLFEQSHIEYCHYRADTLGLNRRPTNCRQAISDRNAIKLINSMSDNWENQLWEGYLNRLAQIDGRRLN